MLTFIVNIASCSCTVIHYVIIPVLRDINTTLMSIFVSLAQDFGFFLGPVPKIFYILSAAYQQTLEGGASPGFRSVTHLGSLGPLLRPIDRDLQPPV